MASSVSSPGLNPISAVPPNKALSSAEPFSPPVKAF